MAAVARLCWVNSTDLISQVRYFGILAENQIHQAVVLPLQLACACHKIRLQSFPALPAN